MSQPRWSRTSIGFRPELLWHVLVAWLDAAKREKLAERFLDSGEWWEDNVAWTRKLPSESYSGHWRSLQ
jgi:hypothetical protein